MPYVDARLPLLCALALIAASGYALRPGARPTVPHRFGRRPVVGDSSR
jgi:hypothetical protein